MSNPIKFGRLRLSFGFDHIFHVRVYSLVQSNNKVPSTLRNFGKGDFWAPWFLCKSSNNLGDQNEVMTISSLIQKLSQIHSWEKKKMHLLLPSLKLGSIEFFKFFYLIKRDRCRATTSTGFTIVIVSFDISY